MKQDPNRPRAEPNAPGWFQNADPFTDSSPFLALVANGSAFWRLHPTRTTAAPGGIASLEPRHAGAPVCHLDYDGGNCTIRAATRRGHAERKLLMVQNPHVAARHASKRFTHWPSAAHLCALSSRWSVIWVPRAALGSAARGELQDLDTSAATSLLESGLFCCHMGGELHH